MRILGIVLLVAGLAGLAFGGFEYTRTKRVVDIGPVQVDTKEKEEVTIPPLLAGGVAVVGLVLALAGRSRKD